MVYLFYFVFVCFVDEPTSSLDSYNAQAILEMLKDLAMSGKQVIATLHQPSSAMFSMLDEICFLANGKVVYFGPRKDVVEYFAKLGYQCPEYTNPAEYIVHEIQKNSQLFIDKWSEYEKETDAKNKKNRKAFDINNLPQLEAKPQAQASLCTQMKVLFKRELNVVRRDKRELWTRFLKILVIGGLIAFLYKNLPDTQQGLRDRYGAIIVIAVHASLGGMIATIVVFPEQRLLFEKERNANMYGTSMYLFIKLLIQIPEQCMFSGLYLLIVYWAIGLNSTFIDAYMILTLCTLTNGAIGLVIGCFAKSSSHAMQILPIVFMPMLLFSNMFVGIDQIPSWLSWLQYLDVYNYAVAAFSITEFQGYNNIKTVDQETCAGFNNGDEYLKYFLGYNANDLDFNRYMAGVLFVCFQFITWIILVRRNGL